MTTTKPRAPRAPKKPMSVSAYQAWFSPETVHELQLEFVLDDADKRNGRLTRNELQPQGRTFTSYTEALHDMLEAEFKKAPNTRIRERQEYGALSYLIETNSISALQRALVRCEKVVQRWINKFHVNDMKAT